jgi:hypothetical protein
MNRIAKHLKTLDKAHPKACLAVGKYYCVVKGNWKRALPVLGMVDDATERRGLTIMPTDVNNY